MSTAGAGGASGLNSMQSAYASGIHVRPVEGLSSIYAGGMQVGLDAVGMQVYRANVFLEGARLVDHGFCVC